MSGMYCGKPAIVPRVGERCCEVMARCSAAGALLTIDGDLLYVVHLPDAPPEGYTAEQLARVLPLPHWSWPRDKWRRPVKTLAT